MRALVLFEFSGIVRDALRARGIDAWSIDLSPCLRSNRYHWRGDATVMGCVADPTLRQQWNLIIAHPPCTRLTNAGVRWLYQGGKGKVIDRDKWEEMERYAALFRWCLNLQIGNVKVAVENPVMHEHALARIGARYSQIIQPYQFGHGEIKKTCLWLQGLPPLRPTNIVAGRKPRVHHESPGIKNGLTRSQRRSITYQGIADAMAQQWGEAQVMSIERTLADLAQFESDMKRIATTKATRLVAIIAKHPGLDAIALKGKGWRPKAHGTLRDAESLGFIEYRNGGWFITKATGAMVSTLSVKSRRVQS